MSYVATIPCQQSTGPVGIITGQTPLSQIPGGLSGLGCAGCGGKCGCNQPGLGLFESGLDVSQWGIGEWACVAGGAYLLVAMVGTTKRATSAVRRKSKALRRAIRA